MPLSDLANILQANTISLDLHEPMIADEYEMIDDDLPVMETNDFDWEQSVYFADINTDRTTWLKVLIKQMPTGSMIKKGRLCAARKEGRKEGTYLFDKTTMYNRYFKIIE